MIFFFFLYRMTSCLVNGKARNGLTFRPVSPEPLTKDACVTKVMCVCALVLTLAVTSSVLVFMT